MNKHAHAWVAAGLVLAVSPSFASPPLGCLENSMGVRWCQGYERQTQEATEVTDMPIYGPHPATLITPPRPYQGVGQQVKTVDVSLLLPGYRPKAQVPKTQPYVQIIESPYAKR